jgi:hypothetical protein
VESLPGLNRRAERRKIEGLIRGAVVKTRTHSIAAAGITPAAQLLEQADGLSVIRKARAPAWLIKIMVARRSA